MGTGLAFIEHIPGGFPFNTVSWVWLPGGNFMVVVFAPIPRAELLVGCTTAAQFALVVVEAVNKALIH